MKNKFIMPFLLFAILIAVFSAKLLLKADDSLITTTPLIGKIIPDFSLPTLDGKKLQSFDIKGKPAIMNFFASWCEYCRFEQPTLKKLSAQTGLPVYGIAWKDEDEKTIFWLKRFGNPYKTIGVDHDGKTGIDFGITGTPESFLIDKNGKIILKQIGELDEQTYDGWLEAIESLK